MKWVFPFLYPAGLLSAARLPIQVAVMTYVGAGGLAGAAVVGGVMLSPAREVVQEVVAPARQFVESVMPMSVPSIFPSEPRAVAGQPIGDARPVSVPSPIAETAPLTVDDFAVEVVVADATPTPQARVVSPLQAGPLAQPVVQPTQPSLRPSIAEQPVVAIERVVPVMPGRPAVALAVPSGLRPDVAYLPARATAAPASTRVAISGATSDNQRAAGVAVPTSIAVHVQTSRIEPTATAPAVPTARPTSVPAAPTPVPVEVPTPAPTAAPTQVPTAAPTQVPTAAPTQAPTVAPTSVPTPEPKKTAAPTQTAAPPAVPTKGPRRPVKATSAPTSGPARAVPSAAPEKEEHSKTETRHNPTEPLGRTADAEPHAKHEGD